MPSRCVATLVFIILFGAGEATQYARASNICEGSWTFETSSLQRARGRLKSPAIRHPADRVECGTSIRDALATEQLPDDCPKCEQEYVSFLLDFIVYARAAAERSASDENRHDYYESEIEARKTLGEFLATASNRDLASKHWQKNFEGLGDAMERIGQGKEFDQEALIASRDHILSNKSYDSWARSIRSCKTWDFALGRDRDMVGLRKVLLCVEDCRTALTRIRQRVNQGRVIDKDLMGEILDSLLPSLEACPVENLP